MVSQAQRNGRRPEEEIIRYRYVRYGTLSSETSGTYHTIASIRHPVYGTSEVRFDVAH